MAGTDDSGSDEQGLLVVINSESFELTRGMHAVQSAQGHPPRARCFVFRTLARYRRFTTFGGSAVSATHAHLSGISLDPTHDLGRIFKPQVLLSHRRTPRHQADARYS